MWAWTTGGKGRAEKEINIPLVPGTQRKKSLVSRGLGALRDWSDQIQLQKCLTVKSL